MSLRRAATLVAILLLAWRAPQAQAPVAGSASGLGAIFVCGDDLRIPAPIPPTWPAVVLAGDGRLYVPCLYGSGSPTSPYQHNLDHREAREAALLETAYALPDPVLHWRAAQAYARLPGALGALVTGSTIAPACNAVVQVIDASSNPRRWQPGRAFMMLRDPNPLVRQEGAFGIGVALSRTGLEPDLITAATKELQACFKMIGLQDSKTAGLILEALGVARYTQTSGVSDAELFIVQESQGNELKVLGAVKGLEVLLRQHPQHDISHLTRARLRELVTFGGGTGSALLETAARIRRLAVMALQTAHDTDSRTLALAADDRDWQVRRLVAGSLNLSDPAQAALGERLTGDPAFQVRYELLSPLARVVLSTHECAPLVAFFKDSSPAVVLHAMDLLPASCTDQDDAIARLREFAADLGNVGSDWHVPSRALSALARIKPAASWASLDVAVKHPTWQVRATAATVSGASGLVSNARTLARDAVPNVRTAALEALYRMKAGQYVIDEAIYALTATDFQLLRTAARVLKGLPDDQKDAASVALLAALRRLTDGRQDPSRDPRVAILERLAETLSPGLSYDLLPYVEDFDDAVSEAASKTFEAVVGSRPAPQPRRRRYPSQPSQIALESPPTQGTIFLEGGATITLTLRPDVAPVTVARFQAMAFQSYYNGLTFHRVVPNFVVQGGSPGANEYAGAARYMRDEVGPQGVHVRGAVGISTRGGDTGDGQIFIDLVDLPRLDRDYTVFAYVTSGMEYVDKLLEGAKIIRISVR